MALDGTTAMFAKDPLTLLRSVTMMPPAAGPVYRKDTTIEIEERSLRLFSKRGTVASALPGIARRFRASLVEMPIGWIRFLPSPESRGALTFDIECSPRKEHASDYTDVTEEFEERIERADRLPIFYLPWQPDHLVRMTIPRYRTETVVDFDSGISIDPYCPHLFFTAMLSGCSVFVHGDPRQPTVVHAGTREGTPYGDDSAGFWRELLTVERMQRLQHDGWAREVNDRDYMGDTATLGRFRAWLARQPRKFDVTLTVPFGAVFGIRYGALWSFYLQENAVVFRYRIRREREAYQVEKKGFFPWSSPTRETRYREVEVRSEREESIPIPLAVRPFYPDGGGKVRFWDTFKRTFG